MPRRSVRSGAGSTEDDTPGWFVSPTRGAEFPTRGGGVDTEGAISSSRHCSLRMFVLGPLSVAR
jgi:hypothetical protein